jgi:hypothetical protein
MCFERFSYRDEAAGEAKSRRLWDLFYRETEETEPPLPVAEQDEGAPSEDDRDRVPVGAER